MKKAGNHAASIPQWKSATAATGAQQFARYVILIYNHLNFITMATIFSKIIAGEIPSHKVAENDRFFAFLDINPLVKGHTLIVPKQETDYIFDLSDDDLAAMNVFAKKVAKAIQKAIPCKKVGVAVIGLEVPHAHIHLIPIQKESDMYFSNPKMKLSDEELSSIAEAIRSAL